MIEVIKQDEWYSRNMCKSNPDTLYVFGDNTAKEGCGGQAQIRHEPNSIGIPTKRRPTMEDDAFFSDMPVQFLKVEQAISEVLCVVLAGKYTKIVFPSDGLGTGLAMLEAKSPVIFGYVHDRLYECFGVKYSNHQYTVEDYSNTWWQV